MVRLLMGANLSFNLTFRGPACSPLEPFTAKAPMTATAAILPFAQALAYPPNG